MIDALLWVGGVAVGLTFGFGVGRRRLEIDDQRVAKTIANLRHDVQDRDLQLNAQRISHNALSSECDALRYALQRAEQNAQHADVGRYGRYRTARGVELRVAILAVATHNNTEYAIIVPSDLPGATPYMIRHDAVTVGAE
jgi:hypothetical protein